MDSFHSYPAVFNLGHKAIESLLTSGPVIVEEKIDGSQFSFGVDDRRRVVGMWRAEGLTVLHCSHDWEKK